MASRLTVSSGDAPLHELAGWTAAGRHAEAPGELSSGAAAACLRSGLPYVCANFVGGATLDAARDAAEALRQHPPKDGDIPVPLPAGLRSLVDLIERLRLELAEATGRPLLESAELQLLSYKEGGSYRRHRDDAAGIQVGCAGRRVRRSVSMLIYLTPDDWRPEDGGALRAYVDGGATAVDILPRGGCLVLFDSATVPHEVLVTRRARTVLAGWYQEAREGG